MDPTEMQRKADEELGTVLVEPEPVEADTDEGDDDDDDSGSAPAADLAPRPSRKERRAARAGNFNELKETNERLARELQETRQAQARMEGMLQANLQRPQQQGPHPIDQELDRVFEEQDQFYQNYSANVGKMSPEERSTAVKRARDLEIRKGELLAQRSMLRAGVGRAPDPNQIRQMAFQEQLNMRYADIAADPKATELGGHIARAMFAEGKPQTWETLDEAAEETRRRLGMKSTRVAPKPTPRQQAPFVGTPKGPATGGGTSSGPVRITKKQAQMAESAYPSLPAAKAHQKWWNEVGKKYA